MGKRLYVGNLLHEMGDADLREVFEAHGEVISAQVIQDRETNRSRGFGFVEMASDEAAEKAIEALNGTEVRGRALTVNVAHQRESRSGGGGGGGGGFRSGGGGGRRY